MGILNVTPDSFSDGGSYTDVSAALGRAEQMVAQGADIIDIGGESTRPGALGVSVQQELDRVMPVLEKLLNLPVPISVDTRKCEVMRAVLAAGADMVNDVGALEDEGALAVVAASRAAVCLMHKQGNPDVMQAEPHYVDVVAEVGDYLLKRASLAESAGIGRERIMIDPGFGFGKTLEHNIQLLQKLANLAESGFPVLAGLSRKSMLGAITGNSVDGRHFESVAAAMLAIQRGAVVVRVHDVKPTKDAIKIMEKIGL
ncbi:MAG: dihydropteroate synthase [Chitinivorax sp.]